MITLIQIYWSNLKMQEILFEAQCIVFIVNSIINNPVLCAMHGLCCQTILPIFQSSLSFAFCHTIL